MLQEPVVTAENVDVNVMSQDTVWTTEKVLDLTLEYGLPILKAIIIFIIGSFIIKWAIKQLDKVMLAKQWDLSIQKFILSLLSWALKIFLVVSVISTLGVDTASLLGIFAGAALAIGLALQGSLANFAGGFLIIMLKPFKIGDLIEAQGEIGHVKEIEIINTTILTPRNKTVIIPNGPLANGNVTNYTTQGNIRVDTTVGIGYNENMKQAKDALLAMLQSNPMVLEDPAPSVNVEELAESSVNLAVRPYCKPEHYWDVFFWTVENTKLVLDKENIEIPYPHAVEIQKEA
ncbi:MAG: mechanosensitive ion channel family protein [Nonlabens sp.]|uniref:mechanosensitive ion channel family protein n=1 Tax=Nonlabens sp. TaxID=1888209 RepID=UPI003EF13980